MPSKPNDLPWSEALLVGLSIALATVLIAINYTPYVNWIDRAGRYFGNDFLNFWFGPYLAGHGQVNLLPDLQGYFAAIRAHFGNILTLYNWSYPPHTPLLLWPLAQLPYHLAFFVFIVGSMAALLAVGLCVVRPAQPVRFLWLAALSPASLLTVICGQNGFATGALLLGGFLCAAMARSKRAGIWLGLLSCKPQLGLLVPVALIAQQRWRTILVAGLCVALLIAASLLVYGARPWVDYLTIVAEYQRQLLERDAGYYAEMLVSAYAAFRTLGLGYGAAMVAQAAVSVACVAAVVTAFRCRQASLTQQLLVLCAAIPLAVPYSMAYDLPALSLMLAGRLCQPARQAQTVLSSWHRAAYIGCWLSPAFFWIAHSRTNGMVPLYLALTLLAAGREVVSSAKNARSPAPAAA